MITIYDIAQATGVSAPTVSKALNGTGHISVKTRDFILAKARELGYEPNSVARSLATKRTYLIGVIYDDPSMQRGFNHPVFSGVLNKFRESVEAAGYDIIFLSCHTKLSYKAHASFRAVEGIAIINADSRLNKEMIALSGIGIPCVSTNASIPGICTIVSDNRKAGYKAAEYLYSKGHRKIGFLSAPNDEYLPASKERFEGFCEFMDEIGHPFDHSYFQQCDYWTVPSGRKAFEELYKRHSDMTAIFAVSDLIAMGVMNYSHEVGLKIPQDLSILGFDDDRVSEYTTPRRTTFRQDSEGIAALAADLLLQHMVGLPVPNKLIHLPCTFVERDSVCSIQVN